MDSLAGMAGWSPWLPPRRSFMLLWLLGLPFAFVSTLGWWSILVCFVVGYGKPSDQLRNGPDMHQLGPALLRQTSGMSPQALTPCSAPAELLGFETIGVEVENPFNYDVNDLPLDLVRAASCARFGSNGGF